jgi:hypothetical protein
MIEEDESRQAHHPLARRPASRFWLVAKDGACPMEILTVDYGDYEALPVFSHEEEAELFLCLGAIGDGWRVRESSAGEVVSLLFGPCVGVDSVALDPSPLMAPEMMGLVRVGRDRFLDLITAPASKRLPPRSGWTQTPGRQNRLLFENSNRHPRSFISAGSRRRRRRVFRPGQRRS